MKIQNPSDPKLKNTSLYKPMGLSSGLHIVMKDGTTKAIGSLKIGDELMIGGKVTNVINDNSSDIYSYKGLEMTGNMKILCDGRWVKAEQTESSKRLTNSEPTPVAIIQSEIGFFVTADNIVFSSNLEDVCEALNTKHKLNAMLSEAFQCFR